MKSVLLSLLLLIAACGNETPDASTQAPERAKPLVYTTFYPTTYFAQRIGGDLVEVVCPLPPEADPIFWKPGTDVVRDYQKADLIVLNGAGFEKWVGTVSLPMAGQLDTAKGFQNEWLSYESAVTHSHGREGAHSHEGLDGHTWLDPNLALRQAEAIHGALVRRLPAREEKLTASFHALRADLESLDSSLKALGKPPEGQWIYASHPAYNYIAKRYGWPVVNLDLDPERLDDPKQLTEIGELIDAKPARYLVWESTPKTEIADRIRSVLHLESVVFSPCEQPAESGDDYLAVMRANIAAIRPAFAP